MKDLRIIATAVVRTAQKGESHGAIYLVDFSSNYFQKIDYKDPSIEWRHRGGERGLRGITFYKDKIYIAASRKILIFDRQLNQIGYLTDNFMRSNHEIRVQDNLLYSVVAKNNSVLIFDLDNEKCIKRYYLSCKIAKNGLPVLHNLSERKTGLRRKDKWHLNNVYPENDRLYISGSHLPWLLYIENDKLYKYADMPLVYHNAQPYESGVLMNYTAKDVIAHTDLEGNIISKWGIPKYSEEKLENSMSEDFARQGFGRGLCFYKDYIIGGSSPATISVYKKDQSNPIKSINLTKDVRYAIHGLEVIDDFIS